MDNYPGLRRALKGKQLRRSLIIMVFAGTILNLLNQGDAILSGGGMSLPGTCLTFVVPIYVSTFSEWGSNGEL